MESRQVSLLIRAYQSGRLDFEYPTPLSRLREQVIINDIEKDFLLEAYKLKTMVAANAIPINPQEGIKRANQFLTGFMELSLPYLFKEGKLVVENNNHLGEVTKDKLSEWNAIIDQYNKEKTIKKK